MDGRQELIDGEVAYTLPPELTHSQTAKETFLLFSARLDKRRVWPYTGYRIAGGWIEPDVSVSWPDQRRDEKYFVGSPMIAVEVLSPDEEIERKLTLYFAEGALEVWVVDARWKTMIVYARQNGQVVRLVVDREYHSAGAQATFSVLRSSSSTGHCNFTGNAATSLVAFGSAPSIRSSTTLTFAVTMGLGVVVAGRVTSEPRG